jgi:hypothetical protein
MNNTSTLAPDLDLMPKEELKKMVGEYVDDLLEATYQFDESLRLSEEDGDYVDEELQEKRGDALQTTRTRLDNLIAYLVNNLP